MRHIPAVELERRYVLAMAVVRLLEWQAGCLTMRRLAIQHAATRRGLGRIALSRRFPRPATELWIFSTERHRRAMRLLGALADQREREFTARLGRSLSHAPTLAPLVVEDLRRHKLRGDLSDFAAREARKIRRLPDVQLAIVPRDRAPGPGGMRPDTADSDRSMPEPDRAAGRETPQEVARG